MTVSKSIFVQTPEDQPIPDDALVPLHTFPVQDEFVWRHTQGTIIELQNEELERRSLNAERRKYKAWVVAPIPNTTTAFHRSWLLLVQPPDGPEIHAFPHTMDSFWVDILTTVEREKETYSLVHIPAVRIPNPFETSDHFRDAKIQTSAVFKLEVPRSWKASEGAHRELDLMNDLRISEPLEVIHQTHLQNVKHHMIILERDVQSITFEAELAALRFLTESKRLKTRRPTPKSARAFQMIQDFRTSWKDYFDLHRDYPQLNNPGAARHRVPGSILQRYKLFSKDLKDAVQGLQKIPNGLFFLNGCPGSGKTEWNMVVASIIQAKNKKQWPRKRSRVLFLVDINKTVDDAANRYFALCKEANLDLRIVRMHGWPMEMRQSTKLHGFQQEEHRESTESSEPDFTSRFLAAFGLSKQTQPSHDPDVAPTLDEASWQYFEAKKKDSFCGLQSLLRKMEDGEVLTSDDWKDLRRLVSQLYRAVLARTDFVATTPVAAYGSFSRLFRPDLIFVDEASHARELTTLIALAYFSPKAWIFTGDVKQTQPFVKNLGARDRQSGMKSNPFAAQLQLSTMARADHVDALNSKLLVNKRAFGNMHRLPSALFYDGKMVSSHVGVALYPDSVAYLRKHLQMISGGRVIDENRIIIDMQLSYEQKLGDSFWNPLHHDWVLSQVVSLIRDKSFRGLQSEDVEGTIMINTPYSAAYKQYLAAVKMWPKEWQRRVKVLTVDRAQGNESDVVFLDMVRTSSTGFMDDPRRLNVSLTRARQAEVIMMRRSMAFRNRGGGRVVRSKFLSQVWEDTKFHGRIVGM